MPAIENVSLLLEHRLPPATVSLLRTAASCAAQLGYRVYLVGGSVRDILLGCPNVDIDLSVEGDGLRLAEALAGAVGGSISARSPFGTAHVKGHNMAIDVATARKERYPYPGALPVVTGGTLADDLLRRDFTVHAMACGIMPDCWGALLDPHGGQADLDARQLRVLHETSFVDDPTRLVRAVRYGARLRFSLEERTERLLRRDRAGLGRLSGTRRWKELHRVLDESQPERALLWCDRLGLLAAIHPALSADPWLAAVFIRARQEANSAPAHALVRSDAKVPAALYFSLLVYRIPTDGLGDLLHDLKPPASFAKPARELIRLRDSESRLAAGDLRPSAVVAYLGGHSPHAVRALAIAAESDEVRAGVNSFLSDWSLVKPRLSAERLMALGVPAGRAVGECLASLRTARLDGFAPSIDEELELAGRWLTDHVGH